jgi:hypothetical protein
MKQDSIWFRGTYRYPSSTVLERALASARAWLDEEELYDLDGEWLRRFVARGSTLRINTQLPLDADRFAAVAVVQALALDAIEGVVEAERGGERLDAFPCGDADD